MMNENIQDSKIMEEDNPIFKSSRELKEKISKIEDKCQQQPKTVNNEAIIRKLHDVKKEYAAIIEEGEAIRQAQKEAAEFFKNQIGLACSALMKLQLQPEGSTTPEELDKLQMMLDIKSDHLEKDRESNDENSESFIKDRAAVKTGNDDVLSSPCDKNDSDKSSEKKPS